MTAATVRPCPGPYFTPDPDIPADHRGVSFCVHCGRAGTPGDARHVLPDVPEQAEHRRRAGENGGDE